MFGEWQFEESTLKFLGYRKITLRKFKKNPEISQGIAAAGSEDPDKSKPIDSG